MLRNKIIVSLLCAALLLCNLSACEQMESAAAEPPAEHTAELSQTSENSASSVKWWEMSEGYTFTDSTGAAVTLTARPEKVAVLFSSFADIWQTAGGTVSITVGESVERGLVRETDVLLVDGGAGKTIDNELLVSYAPDFVIVSADLEAQAETADFLAGLGVPAAKFTVESFEDYCVMLDICTDIMGDKSAYEMYGVEAGAQIDALLARVSKYLEGGEQRDILFIRAGSKSSSTKAKTQADNFVCKMLAELGTCNIAERAPVLLDGLSLEEIVLRDPDYIFITTMGAEAEAVAYMESVFASTGWSALTAVQAGSYTFLPKELFHFKPNARWAEAYEYLAELLYPGMLEND